MKHKHHIIPKHAGGTDDPTNIVYLTVKEHAEAHRKLYKKYGRWQDKLAYEGLSGQIGKDKIMKELYYQNGKDNIHHLHTRSVKEKARQRTKEVNTGRKLTPEHIAKTRRTGQKQPESQKIKVAEALSKEFIITSPNGKQITIKNLREWATKNWLDQGNLTKVAQGKLKQHKGYKVSYKY
jgi:hypothetical protein